MDLDIPQNSAAVTCYDRAVNCYDRAVSQFGRAVSQLDGAVNQCDRAVSFGRDERGFRGWFSCKLVYFDIVTIEPCWWRQAFVNPI